MILMGNMKVGVHFSLRNFEKWFTEKSVRTSAGYSHEPLEGEHGDCVNFRLETGEEEIERRSQATSSCSCCRSARVAREQALNKSMFSWNSFRSTSEL